MASDTRQRLIRTTSRLLRKQGYAATGLNQVMSEADAPKGSMYFHFPGGKEELAAAALDHFSGRVRARMAEMLAARGSVADAVTDYFDATIAYAERTDFVEGCALAAVALDAAADHPALAEVTDKGFDAWIGVVAEGLEAEGHSPAEARRLASFVVVALEGAVVLGKGMRSTEPIAVTRDMVREVLAASANR